MTSKKKVIEMCKSMNCTIEENANEILVDAPDGKQFVDGNCSQMVFSLWDDERKSDLWKFAIERLESGLESAEEMMRAAIAKAKGQ